MAGSSNELFGFIQSGKGSPAYALPGLWFNAGEVHVFTPPRRILRNEADLDAWVAEVRTSCIVKAIRRIAQLRRRIEEVEREMDAMQQAEIYELKKTIEETEAMGGDPLGDLAKQLMQELSERKIQLEIAGRVT